MGKKDDIDQLTNIMSRALRHRIGSIVNKDEFYAEKYSKDSENLLKEAEKVLERRNWNRDDKINIKEELRKKLLKELQEKDFLNDEKFDIMEDEMGNALRGFGIEVDDR
ncbi:hypothetical protein KY366_01200 [Candidatus Woesearchaeota archaeon]|nr:hypothetical protein [Candidatus Woesearchaeota archaeon]